MAATSKVKDLLYEIGRLKKEITELKINRPYGLVWDDKPEKFDKDAENAYPVLRAKGGKFKDVELDVSADHNVLIEGDNYHSLSILSYTHKGNIDLVYIDPPYNTGARDWKYNNDYVGAEDPYRHTKWLSFMNKRLSLARDLLRDEGIICVTIDDYEAPRLWMMLDQIFGADNHLGTVVIRNNPKGRMTGRKVSLVHEYAIFYGKSNAASIRKLPVAPEDKTHSYKQDIDGSWYLPVNLRKQGVDSSYRNRRGIISERYYPIYFDPKTKKLSVTEKLSVVIEPVDPRGEKRIWRRAKEDIEAMYAAGDLTIRSGKNGYQLYYKFRGGLEGQLVQSIWYDAQFSASDYGTRILDDILGAREQFQFPKSPHAVIKTIQATVKNKNSITLDFFAGSGTTGQAILELNKKDGGNRRFILCTNNENKICEEVTYERLKRVMKGYIASSGDKVDGLGGNLKYVKTDFIPKHVEYGLTDEARLDLTRRANLLLALKENTFTKVETADRYEIFSSPTRLTGVYFTEDKDELDAMLQALKKHAKDRIVSIYIFSWKKGAYKSGFEDYPGFHFEDIPEPILDVYRSIGY